MAALTPGRSGDERIVVADGAVDDCREVAARHRASVLSIDGPLGPAAARNRGARVATGEVLVFIDADVVVPVANLVHIESLFGAAPEIAGVFGAYDEEPAQPNFISQYKNLLHSFIHQTSDPVAQTFWAGFGAVRRDVFLEVGGFDERFTRPSVEDIEFGHRLSATGHQVRLDHALRVCHLKRWTFRSLVATDILQRGIPWTQLILRSGRAHNDLNLRSTYRICVVLAYVLVGLILASFWWIDILPLAILPLLLILGLSHGFYRFFLSRRGFWFTLRVLPLHLLYHLYNGVSFAVGSGLFAMQRWLGVSLPGALPADVWRGPVPMLDGSSTRVGPTAEGPKREVRSL